jgi:hypothetical protein
MVLPLLLAEPDRLRCSDGSAQGVRGFTDSILPAPISGWHDVAVVALVAICLWVVVCAIRNGYGVG